MKQRTLPKSISCGKTFRDHTAIHTLEQVHHWLLELGKELEERVVEDRKVNGRLPQLLTVSIYTTQSAGQQTAQWKVRAARIAAMHRVLLREDVCCGAVRGPNDCIIT